MRGSWMRVGPQGTSSQVHQETSFDFQCLGQDELLSHCQPIQISSTTRLPARWSRDAMCTEP